MGKSHNNFITIAKAIGIISVVIWHSRPPHEVGIFVMFFAVPLFFFTSGYFYRKQENLGGGE
jgi:fucose 4-O-acetylase-like acetyltransferase